MSGSKNYGIQRQKEQIRRELMLLISGEMRDPRIPEFVTVTEVELSKDRRSATVFVSIMGTDAEKKGVLIALDRAKGFIRSSLAGKIRMKNFPQLSFKEDHSMSHAHRINDLLDSIKDDLI